ncbi:hypothetical protein CPJCM30710_13330 [Clostridium polyendosporum]|uniref:Uncharacterized protein n=1 Tax=Clostridium polyendosporum TaxID=69208 RepID=A0A919VFZ2_9CLOT|nr:hypothetical protein [Clostridium polyendosporum]GIM28667.1 hypothetical protein CPJCM30710_13330 [Clostridium polyendosporum]
MISNIFFVRKRKLTIMIILLNFLFPIFSIEGLIPWGIAIGCAAISYKNIKNGKKIITKSFTYLLANGLIILSYNIIINSIIKYIAKLGL